MKKDKINTCKSTEEKNTNNKEITRKQALKKAGLITLTSASMLLLLKSPAKASASTPSSTPIW